MKKIISLMKFRVPYYVGPFTDKETRFSWMIKKEGLSTQKITPWNFDDVVDRDASKKKFIERMTNFCTYLTGEKVLPASSFFVQRICVSERIEQSESQRNKGFARKKYSF